MTQKQSALFTLIIASILLLLNSSAAVAKRDPKEAGYTNIAGEATSIRQERTGNNQDLLVGILIALFVVAGIRLLVRQSFEQTED